jgi:hypothetical protein
MFRMQSLDYVFDPCRPDTEAETCDRQVRDVIRLVPSSSGGQETVGPLPIRPRDQSGLLNTKLERRVLETPNSWIEAVVC